MSGFDWLSPFLGTVKTVIIRKICIFCIFSNLTTLKPYRNRIILYKPYTGKVIGSCLKVTGTCKQLY